MSPFYMYFFLYLFMLFCFMVTNVSFNVHKTQKSHNEVTKECDK